MDGPCGEWMDGRTGGCMSRRTGGRRVVGGELSGRTDGWTGAWWGDKAQGRVEGFHLPF